jgi:MFS family permease
MTQFWQFFLVWGVIVGLGAGGVGSVLTATVGNRWFIARRGLALGILGSASSTGQIIFLPLFMAMITYAGWRLGSMALIIVAIVLLPLIFLFMRDDPSEVGLEPYGAGDPKISSNTGAASLRGMSAKNATITGTRNHRSSNFLVVGRQLFCLRWNRERFNRDAPYPARN